jgi:hypothetical protein
MAAHDIGSSSQEIGADETGNLLAKIEQRRNHGSLIQSLESNMYALQQPGIDGMMGQMANLQQPMAEPTMMPAPPALAPVELAAANLRHLGCQLVPASAGELRNSQSEPQIPVDTSSAFRSSGSPSSPGLMGMKMEMDEMEMPGAGDSESVHV